MTNYREILRLKKLGLNNSQIAQSLGCSRTTVIQVLNVAEEKGVSYPLPEDLSDRKLSELLFPSDRSKPESHPRVPRRQNNNNDRPPHTDWGAGRCERDKALCHTCLHRFRTVLPLPAD